MEKKYLYNKQTHTLHLKGFCRFTKGVNDYVPFGSEDEAIAFDGRGVRMCKLCQTKRDKKLGELL